MLREIHFWFEISFTLNTLKGTAGNCDEKSNFLDYHLLRFALPPAC